MTTRPWPWICAALLAACASGSHQDGAPATAIRHVDRPAAPATTATLMGERCKGRTGSCRCRVGADEPETEPPAEGFKRFEIRLAADGGTAMLDSPTLGHFESAGPQEACFYIDAPAGRSTDVVFSARAHNAPAGISPRLRIVEYGPKGPFWYEVIDVECTATDGRCSRQSVDAWAARSTSQRKRGRLDPCGSAVISQLKWDTSGGESERDGGLFRDLNVRFSMEVKKFATQFAPGSTECVPK